MGSVYDLELKMTTLQPWYKSCWDLVGKALPRAKGCEPEVSCRPHPALLSLAAASPTPVRLMSQFLISVIFVELSHTHPE